MRAVITSLLLCAAATAHADGNELWFGGGSRALRSASADAVTSDSLAIGAFGYAHALEVAIPRMAVWVEAGFGWGSASGMMFQSMQTHVGTQAFMIGGRAHYALHRLIDATARFDVGTARTSLSIDDASDSGWGETAYGAVGFDFFAERTEKLAIGLRLELGYTAATPVALTPRAEQSGDTLKIAMAEASIGHLDLGGPTFAVSLVAGF
jgi:hypothetical protein